MKNSNDTIGNRTRDLPACGAVPQPTAPPRVPRYFGINLNSVKTESADLSLCLLKDHLMNDNRGVEYSFMILDAFA